MTAVPVVASTPLAGNPNHTAQAGKTNSIPNNERELQKNKRRNTKRQQGRDRLKKQHVADGGRESNLTELEPGDETPEHPDENGGESESRSRFV